MNPLPPPPRYLLYWITAALCLACCDRDDERLSPGGRVAWHRDELAARLSISGLELTDAGVYTCVARCASGVTRCSAELSVFDAKLAKDSCLLQPPIFVRGIVPPERTVVEGEPVELTVKLEGNDNDDDDRHPLLFGKLRALSVRVILALILVLWKSTRFRIFRIILPRVLCFSSNR